MKKISKQFWLLIIVGIIFFFVYAWFSLSVIQPEANAFEGQKIFSWPDAMANNFFIENFIEKGSFVKEEPYNVILQNYLHPRSVNVVNADIVPMSFLGMLIIYGWIGKIVGSQLIMLLTPLLSVIGVLFFYGLVKEIFNKTVGFISALLLFGLASYWYYANLSMLHTTLFVSFLIVGLYFLIKQNKSPWFAALSGFFIGLALITRSIEFIWVGLLIIVPFFFYLKKVRLKNVLLFLFGAVLPLGALLYYNWQIYGELFTVGYLKMNNAETIVERLPNEFEVAPRSTLVSYLKFIFIPFGFHLKTIVLNFKKYFVEFMFPYFGLFIIAIGTWFACKKNKKQIVYCVTAGLAGLWLVIYYGSWEFIDPMVLKYNTIGSSYTRYWLPLNILILPLVAFLLYEITKLKVSKSLTYGFVTIIIIGLTLYSFGLVYLTPGDGLFAQREVIQTYYDQAKAVDTQIEPNAIIIVNRSDKLFFPKRQVVRFNLDYSIFPLLKKIASDVPVYYFTLMPDKDIDYINERKIKPLELRFTEPLIINGQFRLFKLVRI